MQGGTEVNRIQAADCRWPSGPGQDPDLRAQVNQVDLVQHGRQAGDGVRGVPGQCPERFDLRQHGADPPGLRPLM